VAIALVVLFYSSQRTSHAGPDEIAESPVDELPARLAESTVAPATAEVALTPAPAPPAEAPAAPTSEQAQAVDPVPSPLPAPTPSTVPAPSARTAKVVPPTAAQAEAPSSRAAIAKSSRPAAPVAVAVSDAVASPAPAASPMGEVSVAAQPVAEASQSGEATRPGSRDANRLLGQLSRAYEDGDIQGMRSLFAADARGPKGGLKSILDEYRRVFSDSSERSLSVRDVSWFVSGETFTIVATFEASVTSEHPARSRKTRGDLRLDLRREGDRWQIYRMQHGERQG
jgi:hypothetical protein